MAFFILDHRPCIHCGYSMGMHQANTHHCPAWKRGDVVRIGDRTWSITRYAPREDSNG